MILTIFIVSLLAVSTVNAVDNATSEVVSIEETTDEAISVDEAKEVVNVEDNQEIEQTENEETINATDDGTFTALQNKIDNARGSTITLENDYVYDYGFDIEGIYISKSLTINGNGHTLDGNHASRIFYVDNDVVFRDIIFINGKTTDDGGAIYSNGFSSSILLENCTFEDNQASCGGAIYINNVGNTVVNCRFSGNSVDHKGGAIHIDDKGECTIENCSFIVNSADYWGGAVYGGSAVNCSFEFNNARYGGGAVCWVSVVNCSFKYNSANEAGGAMDEGSAVNCSFVDNHAGTNGGAMHNGNAVNCVFLGNSANYNGGAMRSGSAVKCTFILNSARSGGALQDTDAENCTLQSNHADEYGGAIYWGSAESCIFRDNTANVEGDDTYKTEFTKPILTVSNFISTYNSGEKLIINFTNSKGIPITNANMTIRVYKNDVLAGTYYCLSGDGWVVDLNVGDYVAAVGIENQVYDVNPVKATLKIVKANTMIDCESISVICDDNSELVATLTNVYGKIIESANVVVSLDGVDHALKTNSKGQVKVPLSDLPVGNYTATIYYAGNSEYNSSSTTAKVTVKSSSLVTADATGTYLNSKVSATFLNVDGKALASKQVTFKIGDKTYTGTTNSMGVATVDVDLGVGSYTVTAINPVNNEQKEFKLVISKAASKIALTSAQSGEVVTLTAALTPSAATGSVIFTVNGENRTAAIKSGKATLTLSGLKADNYTVTAFYNGDNNLNASASNTVSFSVAGVYPVLTAGGVTKTYGTATKLVVYLKDNKGNAIAGANVNVDIKGKVTPITTNSNGQASMAIGQAPGTYYAKITYPGAKDVTAKILVKKDTPKIAAKKATFKRTVKIKKYTVRLTTSKNVAIKNAKVFIKIGKKTYSAVTTKKGYAKFKITKLVKKGKYTGVVSYKGNGYFNAKAVKVAIVLK